jgi:hypothetical protein
MLPAKRIVTTAAVIFVGGEEAEIRTWLIKVNDLPLVLLPFSC